MRDTTLNARDRELLFSCCLLSSGDERWLAERVQGLCAAAFETELYSQNKISDVSPKILSGKRRKLEFNIQIQVAPGQF